nr:DNA internalization-related competence protein ComEC/Rec2 [Desulfobacterales bacterium]
MGQKGMHRGSYSEVYVRPLVPILLSLICGIILSLYIRFFNIKYIFFVACLQILFCVFLKYKGLVLHFLPLLLFATLGYLSIQPWLNPKKPINHVSRFIDGHPWHITGAVNRRPEVFQDRTRFTVSVDTLARKGIFFRVTGNIRITVRGRVKDLAYGDRIAALLKLREIHNFNNTGGFDYRRYMAFRHIHAIGFLSDKRLIVRVGESPENSFMKLIERNRDTISGLIEKATDGNEAGIMKALIIGDRSGISRDVREAFSRIGLSHILAISGLHLGIIATLSFFLFRYLMAGSERVLVGGYAIKGAALFTVFPVVFYACLAGMSPATQRSVIMVLIFLLAILVEREQEAMNSLAAAALIILMLNPAALFEISFQLSFCAVFSIFYSMEYILPMIQRKGEHSHTLKYVCISFLVSIFAILGTLPLILYYFNQLSLIGVISNSLFVPLIGFLVIPLGLVAVIIYPANGLISLWIMKGSATVLKECLSLAFSLANWSLAATKTVTPSILEIFIYYGLCWSVLNMKKNVPAKRCLVLFLLILLGDITYWAYMRFGQHNLKLTMIDVGQGSSTLIELPYGRCMLIDGGGFFDNSFDVGARVVAPFLWKKKIASIDFLVLSHPQSDHLNGLVFIARHFRVGEFWTNGRPVDTEPYHDLIEIISRKSIPALYPEDLLLKERKISGVRFRLLSPPVHSKTKKNDGTWQNINNGSLVFKVEFKKVSILITGDIEAGAEARLIRRLGKGLKSTILLVPHHGSRGSSTPDFIDCVSPRLAIISAGWNNIFGFPHKEVLRRYRVRGCRIFRTDLMGAITVTTDGKHIEVSTMHGEHLRLAN